MEYDDTYDICYAHSKLSRRKRAAWEVLVRYWGLEVAHRELALALEWKLPPPPEYFDADPCPWLDA